MLVGNLLIAVAQVGVPRAIRTDNELMFRSRYGVASSMRWDKRHLYVPVCSPDAMGAWSAS